MSTACPKCGFGLQLRQEKGVPLALCGGCHGIWLSVSGLNACVTGDPADATSGLLEALARAPRAAAGEVPARCPGCHEPLVARRVGQVVVDHCSACAGIFLDRGELSAIAEQYQRQVVHGGQATTPGPHVSSEAGELINLLVNPWWE